MTHTLIYLYIFIYIYGEIVCAYLKPRRRRGQRLGRIRRKAAILHGLRHAFSDSILESAFCSYTTNRSDIKYYSNTKVAYNYNTNNVLHFIFLNKHVLYFKSTFHCTVNIHLHVLIGFLTHSVRTSLCGCPFPQKVYY